jgi:hypothetical protein
MTLREFIEIGANCKFDGLEFYTRFLELPGAPSIVPNGVGMI